MRPTWDVMIPYSVPYSPSMKFTITATLTENGVEIDDEGSEAQMLVSLEALIKLGEWAQRKKDEKHKGKKERHRK